MIFITGASGLVGSHLLFLLLSRGHSVRAHARSTNSMRLEHPHLSWRVGDLKDPDFLEDCLKGVDTIFHCAAWVSFQRADARQVIVENISLTRLLVNAALLNGVPEFVHMSSVAAIGRDKRQDTISEDKQWIDSKYNSAYAVSKHLSELEVWRGQEEGLRVLVLNPSVVLGPGNWTQSSTQIFKYVYDQKPFYTPGQVNYIDVRDVAELSVGLWERGIRGERFILSAASTSYHQLLSTIAYGLGRKAPWIMVPAWAIRFFVPLQNIVSALLGLKSIISEDLAQAASTQIKYDTSKVQQALPHNFRSMDQTIKWCCAELLKKI